MDIALKLMREFGLQETQVRNTIALIDDGNTIPFIARYRKELTGSLDDQLLRELYDRLNYLRALEKRKEEVSASITALEKMTPAILQALADADSLAKVEDIYRPYKPKRKTRASVARAKGLEPLAAFLTAQRRDAIDPTVEAQRYVGIPDGPADVQEALQGAMDIVAENLSDSAQVRGRLREYAFGYGVLQSRAAKEADSVYAMYYAFSEPVKRISGHGILAINRGEQEDFLKVSLELDENIALGILYNEALIPGSACTPYVQRAADDAYERLIFPSLEREVRAQLTETASEQAIKVFAMNLSQLLMQPPVKGRVVLGLDPAYRTGCKIAVVDPTGRVLDTTVVYPTPPQNKTEQAQKTLKALIQKYDVQVISIGNGTASRESEMFVADLIKQTPGVSYMVVSEAGASVYSASKLAAQEFPEYDVSLRSAVSIARRLQDPLAELVKIDPKAIGVGQYQHDMPPKRLDEALGGVVEASVNAVGVDLNTASHSLLSHIAGINATVAKNIVAFREENGAFTNRKQLMKVPKLGKKAFEQCAGFLRVPESDNVLDNTGVHPESYRAAELLLKRCGYTMADVRASNLCGLREKVCQIGFAALSEETSTGIPTLQDIVNELLKPGRDPRDELPAPLLRTDVLKLEDLKPGMELMGTVRNVIDFGAFVDIGVHDDGLVHISQMSNRYIRHPSEVLKVGDIVKVKVLDVDIKKKRISLTMKG